MTTPEFSTARIVVCYQNKRSLETNPAQTDNAFIHQTSAKSARLVRRINRQMINISAASVVTAQCNANNGRAIGRHSAQARVAREKVGNSFSVITLGNLETLSPLPQLKRRVVIANGKFSRFDVVAHLRSGTGNRLPARMTSFANRSELASEISNSRLAEPLGDSHNFQYSNAIW
jgi:hypothetical protein